MALKPPMQKFHVFLVIIVRVVTVTFDSSFIIAIVFVKLCNQQFFNDLFIVSHSGKKKRIYSHMLILSLFQYRHITLLDY